MLMLVPSQPPVGLDDDARLEDLARPLLALVQRITGLETSFLTLIDWAAQKQLILFARNSSELQVPEGALVDWKDATCRWAFLSGHAHTSDVPHDFPTSVAAEQFAMRSYLAVPILDGASITGTVCGASRALVTLDDGQLEMVQLVADALSAIVKGETVARAWRDRLQREMDATLVTARQMETLAETDPLTALLNRRGFTARWEQELAGSARYDHPDLIAPGGHRPVQSRERPPWSWPRGRGAAGIGSRPHLGVAVRGRGGAPGW